ncbi:MAG: LptF/LptG family permease [Verrucomicrobiota bacterium]
MRISDRYIGSQVLVGTLYAVAVLGVVLVLGNLFKQLQPLLVDIRAPLELVVRFVMSVLPVSLMYTVPWGFLSAVLLVFRKLSANQEITSFRVAGVSLQRLSLPVFVIGMALSGLSLWLNTRVVPNSKADMLQLFFDQGVRDPTSLLKPGVVQGNFGGGGFKKLLVEGRDGDWVEGFNIYIFPDDGKDDGAVTYVHAKRAALSARQEIGQLRLKLEDAYFETRDAAGGVDIAQAGYVEPLVIDLKKLDESKPKASAMSNDAIRHELATNPELTKGRRVKMESEIMTRYSLSMACLAFAFVAVPLGMQSRRRDNSAGLVMSLLIGAGYFLFLMLADNIKTDARLAALVLWAPNILCVLLGLFLFRRARFR